MWVALVTNKRHWSVIFPIYSRYERRGARSAEAGLREFSSPSLLTTFLTGDLVVTTMMLMIMLMITTMLMMMMMIKMMMMMMMMMVNTMIMR